MDPEITYQVETHRETQISYATTYVWNLKKMMQIKFFFYKTETDAQI